MRGSGAETGDGCLDRLPHQEPRETRWVPADARMRRFLVQCGAGHRPINPKQAPESAETVPVRPNESGQEPGGCHLAEPERPGRARSSGRAWCRSRWGTPTGARTAVANRESRTGTPLLKWMDEALASFPEQCGEAATARLVVASYE